MRHQAKQRFHSHWRQLVQALHLWHPHEVCHSWGRQGYPKGNSWRSLRQSCCIKDTSRQSIQIGFLLANRCIRCKRSRQKMPWLPILRQTHVPAHNLITIPPSWSFACWSLDMIGPLTVAPGGFNHVLVAVDKFTMWIKYKPIVKISSDRAVDFISDIIHRFGYPHTIIIDMCSNLTS